LFTDISINGITPLDHYPPKSYIKNCEQNMRSFKLNIPPQKPDIESINDVKISACVNNYKIIKTILGLKIVINLSFNLKIIYTSLTEQQSVHSAHWDINFCDFILYRNNFNNNLSNLNPNIFIGIEDLSICNFDTRSIEGSLLYLICSNLNCNSPCNNYDPCKDTKKIYKPNLSPRKENNINTYYCPIEYYDDFDKI